MKEILDFYFENELNEILSEKEQNFFDQKKISNDNLVKPQKNLQDIQKNITKKENFIKPVFSLDEAVSGLAMKFNQNNSMNQSFESLNEIVTKAKDLAKSAKNTLELKKIVEDFDGCNLKKMATNTVFCDGNPESKIMVVGEAPGNHEDLQGIPFCGDSGKVLDAMFRAINMIRANDYYITNVVFWRPPGNRRPTEEELAICKPFVERHIQLVNPKIIIIVGSTAMTALLNNSEPISKVRGKFIEFNPDFLSNPIKSFAIFHPSYLMRQPAKKKVAWQDMLAVEKFILENK